MIRTIIGVALGVIGGIILSFAYHAEAEPIIQHEEPKEVLIEIKIDWTEERIKEEIATVFPDAPIMLKVAKCESGFKNVPGKLSDDFGPLQINHVHLREMKKLGLDRNNIQDSIRFARILYDQSGLRPWYSSKDCWSK